MARTLVLLSLLAACSGLRTRHRANSPATRTGHVFKSFTANEFAVYFPETSSDSCDVIMHAVGTATSADKYSQFAESLVEKGYVVVIVDPQRGSISKLDPDKSNTAFELVRASLGEWISTCGSFNRWIIGGHSAGGGTAHQVIATNPSLADAVFSFDPFDLTTNGGNAVHSKPSLIWGFDFTSCFVTMEKAAMKAYELTDTERRVLVRIKKVGGGLFSKPRFFHCSYVDGNCLGCSTLSVTPPELFVDLANTVDQFIEDAFAPTWAPQVVNLELTVETEVFHSDSSVAGSLLSSEEK